MNIKNFNNRLYGRTRGRSKKNIDIVNYNLLIEKYRLNQLISTKEYILDIGTGYGETSIFLANKFPKNIIISCEKYIDGNLNLLKKIEESNIKNINLYPGNVYDVLEKNVGNYFKHVWIFFPDPWPKKKHFKRRLINYEFLQKIHPYIKNSGTISIATDSISYSRNILNVIFNSKKYFLWLNQNSGHLNIKDYYDLETKYYKKAIISGKKPSLFILKKI